MGFESGVKKCRVMCNERAVEKLRDVSSIYEFNFKFST